MCGVINDSLIVVTMLPAVGTRKAEVLNSLIINTTAKANDTTDIYCYAQKMITVVIETFARCQLYRLLWP